MVRLWLLIAAVLTSCSSTITGSDRSDASFDAERFDRDVPPSGLVCGADDVSMRPPYVGRCEGNDMLNCLVWAERAGQGRPAAVWCIDPIGCVPATFCSEPSEPSSCRCGEQPACELDQICTQVDGGAPFCACIASP